MKMKKQEKSEKTREKIRKSDKKDEKKKIVEKPKMKDKKDSKGIKKNKGEKIAIIRIRGDVRINCKIRDTFKMLRLFKKNWCVVVESTPAMQGMVKKLKDYATFGEIEKKVLDMLMKNAEKDKKGKLKPFRLNPPKGGFERKGIKVSFKAGGALGYRGKKINDLIKRML